MYCTNKTLSAQTTHISPKTPLWTDSKRHFTLRVFVLRGFHCRCACYLSFSLCTDTGGLAHATKYRTEILVTTRALLPRQHHNMYDFIIMANCVQNGSCSSNHSLIYVVHTVHGMNVLTHQGLQRQQLAQQLPTPVVGTVVGEVVASVETRAILDNSAYNLKYTCM